MSSPAPDALKTALALVIDPELRRNVVELGMVDSIDVDGAHVHVTIRLTVPGCPLKSNIEAQVKMLVMFQNRTKAGQSDDARGVA